MKINKKLIALSIASTLVLPMVGCNASIKVDDKEIFSYGKDKPQVEEFNKFDITIPYHTITISKS